MFLLLLPHIHSRKGSNGCFIPTLGSSNQLHIEQYVPPTYQLQTCEMVSNGGNPFGNNEYPDHVFAEHIMLYGWGMYVVFCWLLSVNCRDETTVSPFAIKLYRTSVVQDVLHAPATLHQNRLCMGRKG